MRKLQTTARTGEIDAISKEILLAFEKAEKVKNDAYLGGVFKELGSVSARMTTAVEQAKVQSDLAEYDAVRDEKISTLNTLLKGYAVIPMEALALAANNLLKIFNRYGAAMSGLTYLEESSKVNSLLEDLTTSEAQLDIAALTGVGQVVEELKQAQKAFDEVYLKYRFDVSQEKKLVSATSISKEILALLNEKIVPYLTTMFSVDKEKYSTFYETVEELIEDVNSKVSARAKENKEAKAKKKVEEEK